MSSRIRRVVLSINALYKTATRWRRPRTENQEFKFDSLKSNNQIQELQSHREADGSPYVSTRCAIDPSDALSLMLLMTASLCSQIVVALFILLPTIL